jgi:hypothetical protein
MVLNRKYNKDLEGLNGIIENKIYPFPLNLLLSLENFNELFTGVAIRV